MKYFFFYQKMFYSHFMNDIISNILQKEKIKKGHLKYFHAIYLTAILESPGIPQLRNKPRPQTQRPSLRPAPFPHCVIAVS